jgi:hypothetical protein
MRLKAIQLTVIVLAMALAVSLAAQAPAGGQAPRGRRPRRGGRRAHSERWRATWTRPDVNQHVMG